MRWMNFRVRATVLWLVGLAAVGLVAGACVQSFGGLPVWVEGAGPEAAEPDPPVVAAPSDAQDTAPVSSLPYLAMEDYLPLVDRATQTPLEGVFVRTRTEDLVSYPCSTCHTEPVDVLKQASQAEGQLAHWDVELDHADQTTLTCTTCHNVDPTTSDVDTLRTLTGGSLSFDASYQLCAQCHADAYEEWVGGAHGKRVGGWAPPRVIQSCVECHNPHQPQWDIRWPAMRPQEIGR